MLHRHSRHTLHYLWQLSKQLQSTDYTKTNENQFLILNLRSLNIITLSEDTLLLIKTFNFWLKNIRSGAINVVYLRPNPRFKFWWNFSFSPDLILCVRTLSAKSEYSTIRLPSYSDYEVHSSIKYFGNDYFSVSWNVADWLLGKQEVDQLSCHWLRN